MVVLKDKNFKLQFLFQTEIFTMENFDEEFEGLVDITDKLQNKNTQLNRYLNLNSLTERARVKGENPSILALVFSFVDMSTPLTRYVLALLELDILPLRVNSI